MNISYDEQGRPLQMARGDYSLQNVYEARTGFLKERKFSNKANIRYIYKKGAKVMIEVPLVKYHA